MQEEENEQYGGRVTLKRIKYSVENIRIKNTQNVSPRFHLRLAVLHKPNPSPPRQPQQFSSENRSSRTYAAAERAATDGQAATHAASAPPATPSVAS